MIVLIIPLHSFINYSMSSFRAVDVTFSVAYIVCAHLYTGCIKKKVIELQLAIVSELL